MRRPWYLALILALSLILLSPTHAAIAQEEDESASSASADPAYAPLIDSLESDVLSATGELTDYRVTAEMSSAAPGRLATIAGSMTVEYVNDTGGELTELYFRLYPNNAEYAEGGLEVGGASVDGQGVSTSLDRADTLLTVDLEGEVADDDSVEIDLTFTTTIPTDPLQSYGMFKYDSDSNTYSLAHWLPLLAGWDQDYGWDTGPISEIGDPVYTEAAVFAVELTADAHLVFANTGSVLEQTVSGDRATSTYASGPSRDFVMTASSDFLVQSEVVGETTVSSYYWPGSEDGGAATLRATADSLALFNELIGSYPYEELDMVQVEIGNGAGGVEFPGLAYIGSSFYAADGISASVPGILEFIVVHEVLHQWFYNVVGNNHHQHAFLDESLTNYLTLVYFADQYGAEVANEQANIQLRLGYFNVLFNQGDQVVNQPTDDFATMNQYGTIVYGKGALAFMELRREIGTDAFFAALRQYYADFAFAVAQPDDLLAAFEVASGQELDEFWDHWFNEAAGLEDFDATDLARVLRELGE